MSTRGHGRDVESSAATELVAEVVELAEVARGGHWCREQGPSRGG